MRFNKFGNKKVVIDGIEFDSSFEASRYGELKLMQKAGAITNLELQPRFTLIDGFKRGGKKIRATEYVADFRYTEKGRSIVEDTKSSIVEKDSTYRLKRKLLLSRYPDINFVELIGTARRYEVREW